MTANQAPVPMGYADLIDLLEGLPRAVREQRRRKGLTLRDAGEQAGIPSTIVMRVEKGEGTASMKTLLALLRWLST